VTDSVHKKLKSMEIISNVHRMQIPLQIEQLSWTCNAPDIHLLGPNPTFKFTATASMTFPNCQ